MMLHPFPFEAFAVSHPHPQFVAVKSLILKTSKFLITLYHMRRGMFMFQLLKKFLKFFLSLSDTAEQGLCYAVLKSKNRSRETEVR